MDKQNKKELKNPTKRSGTLKNFLQSKKEEIVKRCYTMSAPDLVISVCCAVIVACGVGLGVILNAYAADLKEHKAGLQHVESNHQNEYTEANKSYEPGELNRNPITVSVSDEFSSKHQKWIKEAVVELDAAIQGVKFAFSDDENAMIKIKQKEFYDRNDRDFTVAGVCYEYHESIIKSDIDIFKKCSRLFSETDMKETVKHELLHALKMKHSTIDESIMSYSHSGKRDLAEIDKQNLTNLYPPAPSDLVAPEFDVSVSNKAKVESRQKLIEETLSDAMNQTYESIQASKKQANKYKELQKNSALPLKEYNKHKPTIQTFEESNEK